MRLVSDLKGTGYLISTGSVLLFGAVSWKSASERPILMACLLLGMLLSVVGMMLRWRSHRLWASSDRAPVGHHVIELITIGHHNDSVKPTSLTPSF